MHNGSTSTFSAADGPVQRGVHQVGESLHSTIDRVSAPAHGAVHRASASAHQAVDRLAGGVAAAAGQVDRRLGRVRDTPEQLLACARGYVAARPLKAVAAALALGWLVGRLGARR
ncbi:hypothetical protein [Pseudorhodoferax sp.]|uniref:hypothetical protein n=1 Tax=Pseudorhodoferax sp. TaxID=1993553 RepID=UPI0039E620C7